MRENKESLDIICKKRKEGADVNGFLEMFAEYIYRYGKACAGMASFRIMHEEQVPEEFLEKHNDD